MCLLESKVSEVLMANDTRGLIVKTNRIPLQTYLVDPDFGSHLDDLTPLHSFYDPAILHAMVLGWCRMTNRRHRGTWMTRTVSPWIPD